ncbi:hypothetical protein HNQ51_001598 [Inhella inkyongensis]|uniref:Lipoprotein n=1 Tax=Inhella inkyongensis TaxID=392593 RepID=A0A840S664_9BURK|nr:hypothetical protein [Inhella inkyongensis]MBB5204284.1 hypothetical protein [Inhella inkyongensis]
MGLKKTLGAVLALAWLVVGCSKAADPAKPPAGMEGTWTGSTGQGHRSVTFGQGKMTTTQAGMAGTYQVQYFPDDVVAPMAATLNAVQSVRVEAKNSETGQSIKLTYTVIGGVVLQDALGPLHRRP